MTTTKGIDSVHERKSVPKGTIIMREGERGHSAFLIQRGKVRVFTESNGQRAELSVLEAGQIFGEMALLFDEPRTATVEALEPCNLVLITRETLKQKMERSDPTIRAILPMLMKRLVQTNNSLLQKQSDINEMVETVNLMYSNVHNALAPAQKASLESQVKPQLVEFLKAVTAFNERYGGPADNKS